MLLLVVPLFVSYRALNLILLNCLLIWRILESGGFRSDPPFSFLTPIVGNITDSTWLIAAGRFSLRSALCNTMRMLMYPVAVPSFFPPSPPPPPPRSGTFLLSSFLLLRMGSSECTPINLVTYAVLLYLLDQNRGDIEEEEDDFLAWIGTTGRKAWERHHTTLSFSVAGVIPSLALF